MVERLSGSCTLYREYEGLLGQNERFQEALGAVYYDVLMFLKKAKSVFMSKGSSSHFRKAQLDSRKLGANRCRLQTFL